jgi:hypothetical protein
MEPASAHEPDARALKSHRSGASCADSDVPAGVDAHPVDARALERKRASVGSQPMTNQMSASCLLYLFGDRVLDPLTDKWRRLALGIPVPCADTQVDMFDLAQLLLASAFWNLRTRELIDLEPVHASTSAHNSVWYRLRHLKGRRVDDVMLTVVRQAPLAGLEDAVMTNLSAGDRISVSTQIGQWLGRPCTDACMEVIAAASAEAASRGLCEPVAGSNSTYARWLDCTAHTCFESARDHIAALEPDLYQTVAEWNDFAAAEPDLCCGLLHACFDAVRERQFFPAVTIAGGGCG